MTHIKIPNNISGKRSRELVMTTTTSDCSDCNGIGTKSDVVCGTCNGTGTKPMTRRNKKPLYIS